MAKTTSSMTLSRVSTAKVWNGGTKNQFAPRTETTAARTPAGRPPMAAATTSTSR